MIELPDHTCAGHIWERWGRFGARRRTCPPIGSRPDRGPRIESGHWLPAGGDRRLQLRSWRSPPHITAILRQEGNRCEPVPMRVVESRPPSIEPPGPNA